MADVLLKIARDLAVGDLALLAGGALLQPMVVRDVKLSPLDPNGHHLEIIFDGPQSVMVPEASVIAVLDSQTPWPS